MNAGNRATGPVATRGTVAVVAYTEYPSDPRVRREAETLAREGFSVFVISLAPKDGPSPRILSGVRLYEVPLSVKRGSRGRYLYQYVMFFLLSSLLLVALYARSRFDVIHVHSLPDFLVFCTIPERLLRVPVVLDLHEAMPEILAARFRLPMASPWIRTSQALEWISAAYASRVIAVSELRARIITQRGTDSSKIVVVPNCPDAETPSSAPKEIQQLAERLRGKWVLVEAGGINPERDLETLVRAAGILSRTNPTSLILLGKGDDSYLTRLHEVASHEAGAVDFKLGGWVPHGDVSHYLALSDVGLATYERNPLTEFAAPNKVFECAAARRPLVLADLRALKYEWESAALFYEPGNAEDLAAKILQFLQSPELRKEKVSRALEICERSGWSKTREALIRTFERLSAERGDRAAHLHSLRHES